MLEDNISRRVEGSEREVLMARIAYDRSWALLKTDGRLKLRPRSVISDASKFALSAML